MKQQLFPSILLQRGIGLVAGCWLVGANAQPPISPNDFGAAIASAGDVNGDGTPDLLVGAPLQFGSDNRGQAFVFSGTDGGLLRALETPIDTDTTYIQLHAPRTWRVGQYDSITWSFNAIRGNRTAKIRFAKDGVRFRAIRNVKVRRGEITWKPKRRSVTEQGVLRICVKPAPRVPQVCHSLDISVHGTGQPVQGRLYGRRHGPG